MLINISNHPSADWHESQLNAARQYGEIIDIPFPDVSPSASEEDIMSMADGVESKVKSLGMPENMTVHIMGEHTLCYTLIKRFRALGIACVASTTKREVIMSDDGNQKTASFHFVKFRHYL